MKNIHSYIDTLIDQYATKNFNDAYSLDTDDLPENEISNFLSLLMKDDTSVRDIVLHQMQSLINDQLPRFEANDRYYAGFTPTTDHQTGEKLWK